MRSAYLCILLLLTGCATTPGPDDAPSRQELAGLASLTPAVPALMPPVMQEATARAVERPTMRAPQETIKSLVQTSRQPALQADGAFSALESVVHGRAPDTQDRFAAVLAEALTHPEFACARPVYADYLQQRYGQGIAGGACADKLPFLVVSRKDGTRVEWLDIKRVREIQFVFTAASDSIASRFGHVSLRLDVCPQGKQDKEDCDSNLYEHYSLGFLAQVDELSLNTFKALTGQYRAYLFARPFMDAYEEYAVNEFRDIYALPIKLDAAQRERVLRGLAEIHWQYEGEYSFFGNNCAAMLQQALRTLLPEYAGAPGLNEDYVRPDHLFEAVRHGNWVEAERLNDLKQAERDGYFFSSTRPYYEQALATVREARATSNMQSLEQYTRALPQERRRQRNADAAYAMQLKRNKRLREAETMLEQYAMLYSERMLFSEGGQFLEKQGALDIARLGNKLDAPSRQFLDRCFLAPMLVQFKPVQRYDGIPAQPASPDQLNAPATCLTAEGIQRLREIFNTLVNTESDDWTKLQAISQYWTDTVSNIKELNAM